jgi:hypothetical protein
MSNEIQTVEADGEVVQWGGVDLSAAREQAEEVGASDGGEFLKLAVGKNVVRFLPPVAGAKTCFVIVHEHYIDVPGAKGPGGSGGGGANDAAGVRSRPAAGAAGSSPTTAWRRSSPTPVGGVCPAMESVRDPYTLLRGHVANLLRGHHMPLRFSICLKLLHCRLCSGADVGGNYLSSIGICCNGDRILRVEWRLKS